jgi:hypothetical protein
LHEAFIDGLSMSGPLREASTGPSASDLFHAIEANAASAAAAKSAEHAVARRIRRLDDQADRGHIGLELEAADAVGRRAVWALATRLEFQVDGRVPRPPLRSSVGP